MQVVMICERMHWTFERYKKQPKWFVRLLWDKMTTDAEIEKEKMKDAERKAKYRKGIRG